MKIGLKNNNISFSMASIRTIAFIIFCSISVVLNLNMLILLASTIIEKVVFILVSVGIEGAKIYYVATASVYKKMGKPVRSKVHYGLYAMCAFISISAAYGYVVTTILSTDVIKELQSSTKEIAYIDKDLSYIDKQIDDLSKRQNEDRVIFQKDVSILDSQINILIQEIAEPHPVVKKITEDMDENEINSIKTQNTSTVRAWEQRIAGKKWELENLKKQKMALIDKHNTTDSQITVQINKYRDERNTLLTEQGTLEEKEAKSLETGASKTDMFTAIGNSFGLSGRIIMTLILLFIAFTIEFGIVATVPDPNLTLKALSGVEDPDKQIISSSSEIPSASEMLKKLKEVPPPEKLKEKPKKKPVFKPMFKNGITKKEEPEVQPVSDKKLYTETDLPKKEEPIVQEKEKKEEGIIHGDLMPMFNSDNEELLKRAKKKDITTIVKKKEPPKLDENAIRKKIVLFLTRLYDGKELPENLVEINHAIRYSKCDPVIAKRFFDRIVNLQGNKGLPLFTFIADKNTWRANYSLSYLINEIVSKVKINYHEEKKQVI